MAENIEEAKDLIKTYRSFNVPQIREYAKRYNVYDEATDRLIIGGAFQIANGVIGFGSGATCRLCIPIQMDCSLCIYRIDSKSFSHFGRYCYNGSNEDTYSAIGNANSPKELKKAFRDRANHIEKLLKTIENEK